MVDKVTTSMYTDTNHFDFQIRFITQFHMKISIIGAGMVGSTFAYRLAISGMASQIILVDVNNARAEAEALDISHALPAEGSSTSIQAGAFADTADSDIIVITAGATMKPGQTRLDLMDANTAIMKSVVTQIAPLSPKSILLVASNPLDPMTFAARQFSGFPSNQVIGSGTILDTNRLRYHLAQQLECNPLDVQGFVLGEHGDSQVPIYSGVRVQNMEIDQYCSVTKTQCSLHDLTSIQSKTTKAAYRVKEGKGATYYGIASALFDITAAIVRDEDRILPVSVYVENQLGVQDMYCALPASINRSGVNEIFLPKMTEDEKKQLTKSMQIIAEYCQRIG